jgi:hypothetical protein
VKIKSFEDACKALEIPSDIPFFPAETGAAAFYQLEIIARALNGNWTPDWSNEDQNKYYPWFAFQGGRFVFGGVSYDYTCSDLGSRLCFRTRELAEYAGKTFINLYEKMLHPAAVEDDFSDLF